MVWLERAKQRALQNSVNDAGSAPLVAGVDVGGGEAEPVVYVCECTHDRRRIIAIGAVAEICCTLREKEKGGAGLSRRSDSKLVHLLLLRRARGTLVGAVNREDLHRRAEVEFGVLPIRV
jgi:hypothetical protein